jgi:hypothetical protein
MPGERFSRLYVQPKDLAPDSGRARHRVAALFRETIFNDHAEQLATYIGREVGVPVLGDGRYSSHWNQFIRECCTRDFLDGEPSALAAKAATSTYRRFAEVGGLLSYGVSVRPSLR